MNSETAQFTCVAYVGYSLTKSAVTVAAKNTRDAWGAADSEFRKTNSVVQMLSIERAIK